MRCFNIFLVKEIKEYIKTWKFLLVLLVSLFSAISAPIITKLLPYLYRMIDESLRSLGQEDASMSALLKLSPVDAGTASTYFISNHLELTTLAILVVVSLCIISEKKNGSAILTFTKGLSRSSYILSKFTAASIVTSISYTASYVIFVVLTSVLIEPCLSARGCVSFIIFLPYLLCVISVCMFAGCVFSNLVFALLTGFGTYSLFSIISSIPYIGKFSPASLGNASLEIYAGGYDYTKLIAPLVSTMTITVLCCTFGIYIFKRKEL